MTRSIFRCFAKLFKADIAKHEKGDEKLRELIESVGKNFTDFEQVLDWALNTETIYKNKRQKGIQSEEQIRQSQMKGYANPFSCVCHKKNKECVENFLKDQRISFLFLKYAPEIKKEGYKESPNRRKNRVDCKRGPSEHHIIFPDNPHNLHSSEELSGEQNDLSDQHNDMNVGDDYPQASLEEEKKAAPQKPFKYKSTMNLNDLSNIEKQYLWCHEIDRLIEFSKILTIKDKPKEPA